MLGKIIKVGSSVLGINTVAKESARKVGKSFAEPIRKDFDASMDSLFDEKLYPLAAMLDYSAKRRIAQVGQVTSHIIQDVSELKDDVKSDIEALLINVDEKYKDNLKLTFDEINLARAEALRDLRASLGEVDTALESRINQIALVIMATLKKATEISDNFTPGAFRRELVEPTFDKINEIESQLFCDVNQLIDKLEEIVVGEVEKFRNDIRRLMHTVPKPWDECCRKLGIGWKSGLNFSDIELYRLKECYELHKLNENTPIEKILDTYAQLQHNAALMKHIVKGAPAFQELCIHDWLKYGRLYTFWSQFRN